MQTPPDPSSPVYLLFTLLFFFGALIWLYNLTRPRVIHGTRGGIDSGFERVIETEFTRARGMHDMFNNYGDQDASHADIQLPGDASSMFNNRGQRKQNLRQIKFKSTVEPRSEGESRANQEQSPLNIPQQNSEGQSSGRVNLEQSPSNIPQQSPSDIREKRIKHFTELLEEQKYTKNH